MKQKSGYFLELLAEEIPAWMFSSRLQSIRDELTRTLQTAFGTVPAEDNVVVDATARRIVIALFALPAAQPDREEEVKGPPRSIAFDSEGKPSRALAGFLKKNAASAADIVGGEGDDYIRLVRKIEGRRTSAILGEEIPRIIESLRWPKMMRWGTGEQSWIRPVHSIISIFDGEPLPIEIFGVRSGTSTIGHRILANRAIEVRSYEEYVEKLRKAHVVIHADERVQIMREKARELAAEVGGTPAQDEEIWEQWKYLTEAPGLVRAEFRKEYLELPDEVLVTVMRVHQKQLPVRFDRSLSNSFLAVMDQTGDPDGNAATGNAFVTNARFADARFFRETDRKRPLADRFEQLSHLQFHEKLGNYAEKTTRIETLAVSICRQAGIDPSSAASAARLSKADLVTEMVKEFTELQGKIGGIYAREEGLPAEVWQAIYDQYLPVNADDPLPRSASGAILSLADRLDTLAGFFLLGFRPSGSKDPFALRRAAQGAVQILLNRTGWWIDLSVEQLVDAALGGYGADASAARQARQELLEFFAERVRTLLENSPFAFSYDEVAAAMSSGWANSITDLHDRLTALRQIRSRPEFLSILDSAKRIENIAADAPSSKVDRSILNEPAEERLASLAELTGQQIDELVADKRYLEALETFAGLSGELEDFFVNVLVMVQDEAVRNNRKALLKEVGNLVHSVADVTRIVIDRRDYRG